MALGGIITKQRLAMAAQPFYFSRPWKTGGRDYFVLNKI